MNIDGAQSGVSEGRTLGLHVFDFDFVSSLDQEAVQEVGVGLELGAGLLLDDDRAKKSAGSKSGERIFEPQWVNVDLDTGSTKTIHRHPVPNHGNRENLIWPRTVTTHQCGRCIGVFGHLSHSPAVISLDSLLSSLLDTGGCDSSGLLGMEVAKSSAEDLGAVQATINGLLSRTHPEGEGQKRNSENASQSLGQPVLCASTCLVAFYAKSDSYNVQPE
uniref:Peptidase A1 domain-containing protein n=1 Tax=Ascaris lumbricoides TaxID=6252 RepID=A0A0M3HYH3_ASCLU